MIATVATTSLTATIETFFAGIDLQAADTAVTDLVLDELDQWRNPMHAVAGYTQTFNLVVVAGHQSPAES